MRDNNVSKVLKKALHFIAKETNFFSSINEELNLIYFEIQKLESIKEQRKLSHKALLLSIIIESKIKRCKVNSKLRLKIISHYEKNLETIIKKISHLIKMMKVDGSSIQKKELEEALEILIKHKKDISLAFSKNGPLLKKLKNTQNVDDIREASELINDFLSETLLPSKILLESVDKYSKRILKGKTQEEIKQEYSKYLVYEHLNYTINKADQELTTISKIAQIKDAPSKSIINTLATHFNPPKEVNVKKISSDIDLLNDYFNQTEKTIINFFNEAISLLPTIIGITWTTESVRPICSMINSILLIRRFRKTNNFSNDENFKDLERGILALETLILQLKNQKTIKPFIAEIIEAEIKNFFDI